MEASAVLSQDFSLAAQLRFCVPRMLMSLFIMSYLVADGALISYYLGTDALAALNLIYPLFALLMGFGIMLSAGGGSVTARRLGAGDREGASRAMSSIFIAEAGLGVVLGLLGWILLDPILSFLGIGPHEAPYAEAYQHVALTAMPLLLTSTAAQTFFTTAGYPKVGLYVSIAAGLTNVAFDILFMGPFGLGMTGASVATALSWFVCAAAGLWFFARKRSPIPFRVQIPEWTAVRRAVSSGVSEMVGSLSAAGTLFLFNSAFQQSLGIDGVAALTVAMYSTYVFNSIFYGFCEASSPLLSYKYGKRDWAQLRKVHHQALILMAAFSVLAYGLSRLLARPVLAFFSPEGSAVFNLVMENFHLYALSLFFLCPNMFAAYFFTAFGDGKRAAVVSFCRTFLFMAIAVETLPHVFGEIGLWIAAPASECASFILSSVMVWRNRRRYGYDGRAAIRIIEA